VPLDDLPVYIKAGSILPIQKPTQHLTAGTPDTVTLRVVPKRNALTEADFPFYDEDTDRVVDVTMSVSSDRSTVEVGIDPAERTHIFEVRIEDVHTRPESVTCNGDVVDDEACAFDPQTCEFTISL
jgi:alpha-D-xyloside xylohydrolase